MTMNKQIINQLARFAVIGVANTGIDFTVYFSLTRGWQFWAKWYLVANLIAFITANVFSFIMNKNWTFNNRKYSDYHKQYLKFLLVSLGALGIVEFVLYIFVDALQLHDLLGKIVGILLALVWSFTVHRNWTFK